MINRSNIINLNSYIRMSSIKESFENSCLYISCSDDIKKVLGCTNVIFENSHLKNEFFEYLKLQDINHTVINCLSSIEIFENTMLEATGLIVFDNVCCCRNNEILKEVIEYKEKKMLVC